MLISFRSSFPLSYNLFSRIFFESVRYSNKFLLMDAAFYGFIYFNSALLWVKSAWKVTLYEKRFPSIENQETDLF